MSEGGLAVTVCHAFAMRRAMIVICSLAVAVAIVVGARQARESSGAPAMAPRALTVSYTHLTLPTICSV